jgi:hypothetical protein
MEIRRVSESGEVRVVLCVSHQDVEKLLTSSLDLQRSHELPWLKRRGKVYRQQDQY